MINDTFVRIVSGERHKKYLRLVGEFKWAKDYTYVELPVGSAEKLDMPSMILLKSSSMVDITAEMPFKVLVEPNPAIMKRLGPSEGLKIMHGGEGPTNLEVVVYSPTLAKLAPAAMSELAKQSLDWLVRLYLIK